MKITPTAIPATAKAPIGPRANAWAAASVLTGAPVGCGECMATWYGSLASIAITPLVVPQSGTDPGTGFYVNCAVAFP